MRSARCRCADRAARRRARPPPCCAPLTGTTRRRLVHLSHHRQRLSTHPLPTGLSRRRCRKILRRPCSARHGFQSVFRLGKAGIPRFKRVYRLCWRFNVRYLDQFAYGLETPRPGGISDGHPRAATLRTRGLNGDAYMPLSRAQLSEQSTFIIRVHDVAALQPKLPPGPSPIPCGKPFGLLAKKFDQSVVGRSRHIGSPFSL